MKGKPDRARRRRQGRSFAQQEWAAAMAFASRAWEALSDEQRLSWNLDAKNRRSSGQRRFTGINARRLRNGQGLLTALPVFAPSSPRPLLRRLLITNRRGRIALNLLLTKVPVGTVHSLGLAALQPRPRLV